MAAVLLIIWVSLLCGGAAAYIGSTKGEAVPGFFAGALLGPIGIILAYISRGELDGRSARKSIDRSE